MKIDKSVIRKTYIEQKLQAANLILNKFYAVKQSFRRNLVDFTLVNTVQDAEGSWILSISYILYPLSYIYILSS